ncbi:hypothetical protein TRFO_23022 [Tritrichomonas foetus]|uniref:Uncharacterized protein n=1 Tax=Tritrichomonas foetus TaxID=1144522 RepID=A0A1J4KAR4_9EUKA|nr:hypothetical protein TRFO_23022 [Tritrichomonas foetus]|eukprot:OHT08497.1 hypothetical protein TRFO_23022 [Tritrichomonas foetus]
MSSVSHDRSCKIVFIGDEGLGFEDAMEEISHECGCDFVFCPPHDENHNYYTITSPDPIETVPQTNKSLLPAMHKCGKQSRQVNTNHMDDVLSLSFQLDRCDLIIVFYSCEEPETILQAQHYINECLNLDNKIVILLNIAPKNGKEIEANNIERKFYSFQWSERHNIQHVVNSYLKPA